MAKVEKKADVIAPAVEEKPETGRPSGIYLGLDVIYRRARQGGYSSDLEEFAAKIIGVPPKTSNYQAKDGAVKIKIYTPFGDEVKDVMFAHNPNEFAGRWTFNEKKELA